MTPGLVAPTHLGWFELYKRSLWSLLKPSNCYLQFVEKGFHRWPTCRIVQQQVFYTFVRIRLFVKVRGIAEKLALKLYSGEPGQKGDISAGNQFGTILTGVQKYSGNIFAGDQKYS